MHLSYSGAPDFSTFSSPFLTKGKLEFFVDFSVSRLWLSVGGSVAGDEVLFGLVESRLLELVIPSFCGHVPGTAWAPVVRL